MDPCYNLTTVVTSTGTPVMSRCSTLAATQGTVSSSRIVGSTPSVIPRMSVTSPTSCNERPITTLTLDADAVYSYMSANHE